MHAFERLLVWQKAHELTLRVYRATDDSGAVLYPHLATKLRDTAASIASCLAEGTAVDAQRKLGRYVESAIAATAQLQYQIRLAADLGALSVHDRATLEARADEIVRMFAGLRRTLRSRNGRPHDLEVEIVAPVPSASE
jgi:four helix bundle protein